MVPQRKYWETSHQEKGDWIVEDTNSSCPLLSLGLPLQAEEPQPSATYRGRALKSSPQSGPLFWTLLIAFSTPIVLTLETIITYWELTVCQALC